MELYYYTYEVLNDAWQVVGHITVQAISEMEAFFIANSRVPADCIVELIKVECGA